MSSAIPMVQRVNEGVEATLWQRFDGAGIADEERG